ncbi:MAG: hypothetical protein L6R40_007840 [Gallowayella cf. fulva]|nr:MAG: hypothetical protein L6R40_007840 [Xanthomendoza cf. fulva]
MIRYTATPPSKGQRILQGSLSITESLKTNNGSHSPASAGAHTPNTYRRRPDHTPKTTQAEEKTYIIALKTDPAHHKVVTALRNTYFPTKRNKLTAHIALFRALPGSQLQSIRQVVQNLVRQTRSFPISTGEPFLMARGVGISADVQPANHIFQTLKEKWHRFLSKQDHTFDAHYTIQNKVEKSVAEKTLEEVQSSFRGSEGTVTGLLLYFYDREYWKLLNVYWFKDGKEVEKTFVAKKTGGGRGRC